MKISRRKFSADQKWYTPNEMPNSPPPEKLAKTKDKLRNENKLDNNWATDKNSIGWGNESRLCRATTYQGPATPVLITTRWVVSRDDGIPLGWTLVSTQFLQKVFLIPSCLKKPCFAKGKSDKNRCIHLKAFVQFTLNQYRILAERFQPSSEENNITFC